MQTLLLLIVAVLALPVLLFLVLPSVLGGGSEPSAPEPTGWSTPSNDDWAFPTSSSTSLTPGTGTSGTATTTGTATTSVAARACTPSNAGAYGRVAVGDGTSCELGQAVRQAFVTAAEQQRTGPLIVWDAAGRRPLVFTCTGNRTVRCAAEGGSVVYLSTATAYLAS